MTKHYENNLEPNSNQCNEVGNTKGCPETCNKECSPSNSNSKSIMSNSSNPSKTFAAVPQNMSLKKRIIQWIKSPQFLKDKATDGKSNAKPTKTFSK